MNTMEDTHRSHTPGGWISSRGMWSDLRADPLALLCAAIFGAFFLVWTVPAVPQALSKGVIDATVIPWEVTGALKIPELVTNHTTFGDASLYTTTFVFAMNKAK